MKFIFLISGILIAANAVAYIPPSNFQIAELVKKHRGLKSLRIKTRITGTSTQIREIGYFDSNTRIWRAKFLNSGDHEIYAYERKMGTGDSLTSLLLFELNAEKASAGLKAAGIPIVTEKELLALSGEPERRAAETTSIGRLDKKIGWVIGKGTPSLWILKDEFYPLKLNLAGMEIRFEETKLIRDFPYPRSISILHDSAFVLKGEAMEVMQNPEPSDMKMIKADGLPSIPSTLPSEERALIEQWVQWIR